MKIWIVCDNNADETIILFKTLEKAQKYVSENYEGWGGLEFKTDDCWIFDENGTEVK